MSDHKIQGRGYRLGGFMLIATMLLVFTFLIDCSKKSSSPDGPLQIEIQNISDCKSGYLARMTDGTPNDLDCIEYEYTVDGVLRLDHINAGFNCCPEIHAQIGIDNNVITIRETEISAQCLCQCLFDLDYRVTGLVPGVYTIVVIEPYLNDIDQRLEFEVDLTAAPSGTYCAHREHYPWDQPE